ncbi:MAG: rod shape-determining protein MreD [Alphaproteobacteria bacterium]
MRLTQPPGETRHLIAALLPAVTTILCVLAGIIPAGVPGFSTVSPLFSVAAIFFWVVARPNLMPPAAVFGIGLLQDILSGGPIGLWALTLLLVQYLSLSQRRFVVGQTFGLGWIGLSSIVIGAACLAWLGACLYYGELFSAAPVLVQAALTILVYPAVAWVLVGISSWMPKPQ